jgi:hypothetical protein
LLLLCRWLASLAWFGSRWLACPKRGVLDMEFENVKVIINGKEIEINPFVTSIFGNIIIGMLSSLKLDDEPKEIEIKLTMK